MKNISILGVTGSIGTSALDVIRKDDNLKLVAASCRKSLAKLKDIILEFNPLYVSVADEEDAILIKNFIKEKGLDIKVYFGEEGLVKISTLDEVDVVLTSVVGLSGLRPTVEAIKCKKDIALANKETLVAAGEIVMKLAKEYGVKILPVDSEHSAIFQSLQGEKENKIKKILLTASGGPFRGKDLNFIKNATLEMALNHPTWNMGQKVTLDSASLLNKGLEMIEARWLFDVEPNNISVHVHKESIVHSAVEFTDNNVIAQLSVPDMKLPIQYALNYPIRKEAVCEELDLFKIQSLTFEKPDLEVFKCLKLAYEAIKFGGFYPLILNTADEVAVEMLLNKKIKFYQVADAIELAMKKYGNFEGEFNLENIFKLDGIIREELPKIIGYEI